MARWDGSGLVVGVEADRWFEFTVWLGSFLVGLTIAAAASDSTVKTVEVIAQALLTSSFEGYLHWSGGHG